MNMGVKGGISPPPPMGKYFGHCMPIFEESTTFNCKIFGGIHLGLSAP